VKESGDCLTAGEKQTGQTGVYGGGAAVTQASVPTTVPASASTAQAAQPVAAPQAGSCSKSWLWPFVKESGDCLTAAEKGAGQTGVYGGSGAPAVTQASATATVPASGTATGASQPAPAPAPQAVSCSKGLFWPFKRESGDCPSDADKRNPGQK
jgi:hypothetical protein